MDKKQLIIPAVTLALCMLVVVGVGYALDTSVDNSGNNVTIDGYEIELNNGSTVTTDKVFDAGVIEYHKVTQTGAAQSEKYIVDAGTTVTLSDEVTLKSKQASTGVPFAGELTVTITDDNKNLQKFFGDTLYVNIDGKGAVALTTVDGITYNSTPTIAFDGDGSVVLTGTTVGNELTEVPAFVGTFTVTFSLAPSA